MTETPEPAGEAETRQSSKPWFGSAWTLACAAIALVLGVVLIAVLVNDSDSAASGTCAPRDVAQKAMQSVVTILVSSPAGASNGSGEFIDTEGHVLTNNHVISSAALDGGTITVQRPSGETLEATLVGRDNDTDLAVVKVQTDQKIVPIPFADAEAVGQQAFAIGAPLGLADTFTAGVVSALGRTIRVPADHDTTALVTSAIQTDADINPGNSGGTLANCAGQLIGVPTAGATANDSAGQAVAGSIGLGFAIPADFAHRIAEKLIADGKVTHGDFGMSVVPVSRTGGSTPDGLFVSSVLPGGAAGRAGLRQGDIINTLDGKDVTSADQLQAISISKGPGDEVKIGYERAGKHTTTTLTLATSSAVAPGG